jgi:hypothetical protein
VERVKDLHGAGDRVHGPAQLSGELFGNHDRHGQGFTASRENLEIAEERLSLIHGRGKLFLNVHDHQNCCIGVKHGVSLRFQGFRRT